MPTMQMCSAWSVLAVPENRGQGAGLPKDPNVKTVGNDPRLSSRFGTSVRTSENDYKAAMQLLKEEQIATREDLLNQIQALRLAGARKALAKGQLQTFSMLLKDMGAVIQEAEPLTGAEDAVNLNISIEDKRQ